MNITAYLSDVHACGPVRLEAPAREINKRFRNHSVVCKTDVQISDYSRSNVMVWQRVSEADLLPKIGLAKAHGIKSIYEIDDDFFNIPQEFQKPYIYYAQPEVQSAIKASIAACDALTVSTFTLAKAMRSHAPDKPIYVVENTLDVERWESAYAAKQANPSDAITIGWMASGSHQSDAPLVMPALLRALQENPRVRIKLIGWVGWGQMADVFKQYQDRITTMDWVDHNMLPCVMQDIDIGICATIDNQFNRCKSSIKWLQYSALGAATIASDLDPYEAILNGVDGVKVPETREAWADAVSALVADDAGRIKMGAMARQRLLRDYDVRNRCGEWTAVFDRVCR